MDESFILWASQVVFGIAQGVTEVFPISSSAHTAIGRVIWAGLVGPSSVTFSTAVFFHVGTFFAILCWYWRDVFLLCRSAVRTIVRWPPRWVTGATHEHPLGQQTPFYMLGSLLVTIALGLSLRRAAESVFDHPIWATGFLTANGLCLLAASSYAKRTSRLIHELPDLGHWPYLLIGMAQGFAVIPGISRFGLTLVAGLLCGLGWFGALRLSFLLSLPTVFAAAVLELRHVATSLTLPVLLPIGAGILAAAVSGWLAIRVIRRDDLHAEHALMAFGAYCVAAGPFYSLYIACLGVGQG